AVSGLTGNGIGGGSIESWFAATARTLSDTRIWPVCAPVRILTESCLSAGSQVAAAVAPPPKVTLETLARSVPLIATIWWTAADDGSTVNATAPVGSPSCGPARG